MNMKNIFIRMLFVGLLILSTGASAQITEKHGIYFKNFVLNPDTNHTISNANKNDNNLASGPIIPPYSKTDFMINTLDGEYGSEQSRESATMDGNGNYAFTWIDTRNGKNEIFVQFFNDGGNKIGNNFKVNESMLSGNNSPFIAANKNGDFVVTWLKNFNVVVAQRFSNTAQKIGENIEVNTTYGHNTMEPSAAVYKDGSFMIMWASETGSWHYTVYARVFGKDGLPLGNDIVVSEPDKNASSIGQGKHIDVDAEGNYCITWSSNTTSGTTSEIYLQIVNIAGQLIGTNTIVSNPDDGLRKYFPCISSTDDGNFIIVWNVNNNYPVNDELGIRIYSHNNSSFITDVINYDTGLSWAGYTASSDRDSTFYILLPNDSRQYIQKIKSTGEIISDTILVKFNSTNANYSFVNEMTDVINNRFVIGVAKYDRNDANIYMQIFNSEITPLGLFEKVHDDAGSAPQRKSLVKFNNRGEAIVLWEDKRNGRYDLYAQVFDKDFNPVGENIQINNTGTDYWFLNNKVVATQSDGTFVITYTGSDEYSRDIVWLQKVSSAGKKIGDNLMVKGKLYYEQYELALNVNGNDEILVCWYNRYGANLRVFDGNLVQVVPETNFKTFSKDSAFYPLTISVDDKFNVFAVWRDYSLTNYTSNPRIYGQFHDRYGKATTSSFVIDSVSTNSSFIRCKNYGTNNYVVVYDESYMYKIKRKYTFDKDYYYNTVLNQKYYSILYSNIVKFDNQKLLITYNNNLQVLGFYANDNKNLSINYKIHEYESLNTTHDKYDGINGADIFNDKLLFTFENNQYTGTGYDIWANVRKMENINFSDEYFYSRKNSDYLYPNSPNPFNPKTKITYSLLAYHRVKLSVYDVLGREVKVLVDENQEKGVYDVDFNAAGLASGVYFYKLEAFDTTVKKMILIK